MPPWYADPRHGKFRNDRSMPKERARGCWPGSITACPGATPRICRRRSSSPIKDKSVSRTWL